MLIYAHSYCNDCLLFPLRQYFFDRDSRKAQFQNKLRTIFNDLSVLYLTLILLKLFSKLFFFLFSPLFSLDCFQGFLILQSFWFCFCLFVVGCPCFWYTMAISVPLGQCCCHADGSAAVQVTSYRAFRRTFTDSLTTAQSSATTLEKSFRSLRADTSKCLLKAALAIP